MMEILWIVALAVDLCQYHVDNQPIAHRTRTVIIKFANPLVTTIWNVVLMKYAIKANA